MSDKKVPEDKFVDINVIKGDAQLNITVPAEMFERLQNLLYSGIHFKDPETAKRAITAVAAGTKDPNAETYHVRTLVWLLGLIEEAAEKQDQTLVKKFNLTTGKHVD